MVPYNLYQKRSIKRILCHFYLFIHSINLLMLTPQEQIEPHQWSFYLQLLFCMTDGYRTPVIFPYLVHFKFKRKWKQRL